jgi:glycosyltransferase involved in cell wall biosynthesis
MFRFWGEPRARIEAMEKQMCRRADLIVPDSARIAGYMVDVLGVDPSKITVLPMATRAENLLSAAPSEPLELPPDVADMSRPVAGVIGNLAANTDWVLLSKVIARTEWLSWVFVGPSEMSVPDQAQRLAREELMAMGGRIRFTGYKPYGRLRDYARALDVAVLPYRAVEPTFSGSSTRFYEHLAACRPMLSTRGFAELLDKEPLLRLIDDADGLEGELLRLKRSGFRDGNEELRWATSQNETWENRASSMIAASQEKMA